jgi:hypothetical protein
VGVDPAGVTAAEKLHDTSVVDAYTAVLALAAFAVLIRKHGKLTVLYVVLGCGLIGVALQLTVV